MLRVAQLFASLRYNDPALIDLLGGREARLDFPIMQGLKAEWTREAAQLAKHEALIAVLTFRFGPEASDLVEGLRSVGELDRLSEHFQLALSCPDLDTFRDRLRSLPSSGLEGGKGLND